MLTKTDRIKCDECGRWIKYDDLDSGEAMHFMKYPDSEFTFETWESLCRRCYKKED